MSASWAQQTIASLVSSNFRIAEALHFLGIRFQDYADLTWDELCQRRGLDPAILDREMHVVGLAPNAQNLALINYPAELVLAYLRHAHHQFIKVRLPFMIQLIGQIDWQQVAADHPAHDLKLLIPDIAQDFIWHIYEEEDQLFSYIELLVAAVKGKANMGKVFLAMERQSIYAHASEHEAHEDEMAGLRQLTNNYSAPEGSPLGLQVLYAELAAFEQELKIHANIENRILFPKALKLEHEVKYHLLNRAKLN